MHAIGLCTGISDHLNLFVHERGRCSCAQIWKKEDGEERSTCVNMNWFDCAHGRKLPKARRGMYFDYKSPVSQSACSN